MNHVRAKVLSMTGIAALLLTACAAGAESQPTAASPSASDVYLTQLEQASRDMQALEENLQLKGEAAPPGSAWMPNPASVYCVEIKGGVEETKTDSEGNEYGFCTLPDGTSGDTWDLYRAASDLAMEFEASQGSDSE